ncbi:MAG: ABC transporter ATP-binding protein [Desulfurococcales archaeon]|nr:ABC transporter ATP-binding protein [Desulfurococcales archaeon]
MPVLEVENLKTYFYTLRGIVKAVDNVSFTVERGEIMGLAGESGCGKSTVAWSLLGLVPPPGRIVDGSIRIDGMDITRMSEAEIRRKIRWSKISMVFQGAMNALSPVHRVGDQIIEPLLIHKGMEKSEAYSIAEDLVQQVGLPPEILKRYPHELSGGQKQRIVIAMALIMEPDIIIADEPTTALDVIVQGQIINLLKSISKKKGISIIIISHDLSVIAEMADKVAIMYAGKIVEYGPSEKIFKEPQHPYTQLLLRAIPRLHGVKEKLIYIPGSPPDLRNPPRGCRFHPRCPYVMDVCRVEEPPLFQVGHQHYSACWLNKESGVAATKALEEAKA